MTHLADHDRQPFQVIMFSLNSGDVNINVILERFRKLNRIDIAALKVKMHVDEVKAAIGAAGCEAVEVCKTCRSAAVGDGRGAKRRLTGEGLHVILVDFDAVVDVEVGLTSIIWLVGAVRRLVSLPSHGVMDSERSAYPKRVVEPL